MNFNIILENLPIPTLVLDLLSNTIAYANNAFISLVVTPQKEMIGKSMEVLDLFMTAEERKMVFRSLIETESDEINVHLRCRNKVIKTACRISSIIQDEYAYGICSFVEMQKEPEATQTPKHSYAAEPNASVRNHELRTSLTTLIGISQLVAEEMNPVKIKALTQNIVKAGKSVLEMMEGLEIGSPVDNKPINQADKVDIIPILKETIYNYADVIKRRNLHLKFTSFENSVELNVNEALIGEVLHSVMGMATGHSTQGDISVSLVEKYSLGKHWISIRIANHGIGIKKAHLDSLDNVPKESASTNFTEDIRAERELTICKQKVESMGGNFSIESTYGVGTTIIITFAKSQREEQIALDRAKQIATKITEEAQISKEGGFLPDVLLVDDDPMIYQLVKKFLIGMCNLDYVPDGRRALITVTKKKYHFIFMDINLGVGLTGLQVVKKIRDIPAYYSVPVVAITAYALPGDKERALESGCNYYLSKPFSKQSFLATFNQCLMKVSAD